MSNLKKFVAGFSTLALAMSMFAFVPVANVNAATAGGVYKDTSGTVWFVTDSMQKRAFTSWGAFLSYGFLSASQIMDADASVTALPTGSFIAPQDGRIFCATETKGTDVTGECSLITAGKKAAFTSASVFTGQGYSFARAYYGDSSFLEKTSNIDNASAQHRPGTLINNNGTVQLVVAGGLWGTPSMDVFNSWGWSFADVVPANSADLLLSQTGVIKARQAGELSPSISDDDETPANCDDLQGNAGDITVSQDSTFSSEEVGEGESEVGVLGFEVEADDDSDVAVTSIKVELKQTDNTVSQDIEDYVDEVLVMHGDDVVGSADADEFTENSDVFTKSISLDCAAVASGETGEFTIAISALDNLDSADIATDNWEAELMQVRFEDGDGVTTTESITADSIDEPFDFVDFATAADVELRASLTSDADDINDAHNVIVEDDSSTDDEPILAFTLSAEGDSDIWVDELTVDIDGSDSDLDTVISSAALYLGDTKLDEVNVTDAGSDGEEQVVFEDLDTTIDAGDEEEFEVRVDIRETDDGTNYAQGATLEAFLVVAATEAEDEDGEDVASADLTGSAIGEAVSLFSEGITVDVVEKDTLVSSVDGATNDTVSFQWTLEITNVGDDTVYVNADNADVVSSSTAADVDQVYAIQNSGAVVTATGATVDSDDDSTAADASAYGGDYSGETFFSIDSGDSITIEIVVSGQNATTAGQTRAYLSSIEWTTDDITCATACDATGETINSFTADLQSMSETPYRAIN